MTELLDFWFKLLASRNIARKIRRDAWLILEVERNRFYSTEMYVGNNVAAFFKRRRRWKRRRQITDSSFKLM
jgi:hypothetical protein